MVGTARALLPPLRALLDLLLPPGLGMLRAKCLTEESETNLQSLYVDNGPLKNPWWTFLQDPAGVLVRQRDTSR